MLNSQLVNLNTYSTTETLIGTFLGVPLYRKAYNVNIQHPTDSTITYDINSITGYPVKAWAVTSGSVIYRVECSYGNSKIYIPKSISSGAYIKAIVTEYTKTKW